jgi:hypothetical protein
LTRVYRGFDLRRDSGCIGSLAYKQGADLLERRNALLRLRRCQKFFRLLEFAATCKNANAQASCGKIVELLHGLLQK